MDTPNKYKDAANAYEAALSEILHAKNLLQAKELAAEILDLDVDEYLVDELELDEEGDLDFGDSANTEW